MGRPQWLTILFRVLATNAKHSDYSLRFHWKFAQNLNQVVLFMWLVFLSEGPFCTAFLYRPLNAFPGYLALHLMKLAYLKNFGWCWLCPNERPCSDLWLISNELVSTDSPNHPKIENMAFLFRKVMIFETTWTQRTTPGGW